MSTTRKKKLKERQTKLAKHQRKKRSRFDTVLAALGLLDGFRKMPRAVQDFFYKNQLPDPQMIPTPSSATCPEVLAIVADFQALLAEETVGPADGPRVSLPDFLAVCVPLAHCFARVPTGSGMPIDAAYVGRAAARARDYLDAHLDGAITRLSAAVAEAVMRPTRVDRRLFWCAAEPVRPQVRFRLHAAEPQRVQVAVDEVPRPAYRCGAYFGGDELTWVSWRAADLGLPGDAEYPVFVQGHALRQLDERLPLRGGEYLVHGFLLHSLLRPTVVERRDDDYLVEFRFAGYRLGYLVTRRLEDKVLVRTFLFLTMAGTPEARLLHEKLRLRRPDVIYCGLDRLATYLTTDVQQDPELVELLTECGCGQLFALANPEFRARWRSGFAADLRTYLGLPKT